MDTSLVVWDELLSGVGMSVEVLETEICRRAANVTAAEGEWLALVAEFDTRRGWARSGCRSCAAWLMWQIGLDRRTAHEKVRVAHVLVAFPPLAMAMARGWLPYAKVRALSRIVTWDNVDELVTVGQAVTTAEVERVVAAYRRCEPDAIDAEARAHADRAVSIRHDEATTVITIRVPAEAGAVLQACLDRFVDDDTGVALKTRRADAMVAMAEHAVATIDQPAQRDDRYLATIHLTPDIFNDTSSGHDGGAHDGDVDHDDHADGTGHDGGDPTDDGDHHGDGDHADVGHAGGGHGGGRGLCCVAPGGGLADDPVAVPVATARRLLCDAVLVGYRSRADGGIEQVGHSHRVVSRRLKRALRLRDGGCRFPGCTHTVWVDAHHVQHWVEFGPTLDINLLCLCRQHHRLVHEEGWFISGDPNRDVFFHKPDGSVVDAQPVLHIAAAEQVDDYRRSADDARDRSGNAPNLAGLLEFIRLGEQHRHPN